MNVPNNVTIPQGTRRLIKVDAAIWYETFFGQIRREVNIPIVGIMGNLIDFKLHTAYHCELSMAITKLGKTPMNVLPHDP